MTHVSVGAHTRDVDVELNLDVCLLLLLTCTFGGRSTEVFDDLILIEHGSNWAPEAGLPTIILPSANDK